MVWEKNDEPFLTRRVVRGKIDEPALARHAHWKEVDEPALARHAHWKEVDEPALTRHICELRRAQAEHSLSTAQADLKQHKSTAQVI